jgi:predicted Ser/Thr protein kinase
MEKVKINEKGTKNLLRKIFPDMKIKKIEKFSKGLTSGLVLKIKINNPNKILVLKLAKLKRKAEIDKNNKILDYLNKNKIPSPKIFYSGSYNRKIATIMEYVKGDIAGNIYVKGDKKLRKKILENAGKILNKIHKFKVPSFWVHQHHEIKNSEEWKGWTKVSKFCRKKSA